MASFELSQEADSDLAGIFAYGYRLFGPDQAADHLNSLDQCFRFLAANPGAGRERADFDPPVRCHYQRRHLVFYDVRGHDILIVRVLHDSMDTGRHMA